MTKKRFATPLLAILVFLLIAAPVFAVAYRTPVAVVESAATSYTMLPVSLTMDNQYLIDNGFYVNTEGLDTLVETLGGSVKPHMLVDDRTLFATTVPATSQTNLYLTTDNTPLPDFHILTGYNGYVTILDDLALELGNDFEIEVSGYFNAAVADNVLTKDGAIEIEGDGAGNITVNVGYGEYTRQVLCGGAGNALVVGTTYNALVGGYTWHAAEANVLQIMPTSGTLSDLQFVTSAAIGAGASYTFTVLKNGVPTALLCVVDDGETTGSNTTDSVSFAAGDTMCIKSVSAGAPGIPIASWSTVWTGAIAGETLFILHAYCQTAAPKYFETQGWTFGDAVELNVQAPIPTDGTFKKLYVNQEVAAGASGGTDDAYVYTFRDPGGDTALTCTVTNPATTGNDIINTAAVNAGDLISIYPTQLSAPANSTSVSVSMVFVPDNVGESVIMGGGYQNQPAVAADEYIPFIGRGSGAWLAVEADSSDLYQSSVLSDLYVKLSVAPDNGGGVQSYTLTPRLAGAPTGLSVTISELDTTGNDTVNTLANATDGILSSMMSHPIGTPALTQMHWGMVSYYPAATLSTAITTGPRVISVSLAAGTLSIQVDAAAPATVAFAGSIFDNANDWVILPGTLTPYVSYYEHTVSSVLVVDYEPVAMIIGTTLPDKAGAAHDGTFTFGTNPAGVAVTLGSMVAADQPVPGTVTERETRDIIGPAGGSDWSADPAVADSLLTHPLRSFVTMVSDNTSLTESQSWLWGGIAFVLFVIALSIKFLGGHKLLIGVAVAVAIITLVVQSIFPIFAVVFAVIVILAGILAERSPSL